MNCCNIYNTKIRVVITSFRFFTILLIFLLSFIPMGFTGEPLYSDSNISNNNLSSTSSTNPHFSISGSDMIYISLLSPVNGSIVNGGTTIVFDFLDENGSLVTPVTESYRWDQQGNFENLLRPLPMDDGLHILEVQVESLSGIWSDSTFHFYSDNKPHDISLLSPSNGSYQAGGIDYDIWSSSSPTGSLTTIELYDANNDSLLDVITGGSSGIIYSINGKYGSDIGSSSFQSAPISVIENLNSSISVVGLSDGTFRIFTNQYNSMLYTNTSVSSPVINILTVPNSNEFIVLNSEELRSFDFDGNFNWNFSLFNNPHDFLLLDDFNNDSSFEVLIINQSSYVSIINSTNGTFLGGFSLLSSLEDVTIHSDSLYVSTTFGTVAKYNLSSSLLNWSTLVVPAQNIYQIKWTDIGLVGSSGNGRLFLLNDFTGSIIWDIQASSTFIKHIFINDFDKDSFDEIIVLDGASLIHNFAITNGSENWVSSSTNINFNGGLISDLDNNTFDDLVVISTNGEVFVFDPRARLPKLTPAWTNVSFAFDDEISGNVTVWEKYSWDGNPNVSSPGFIPSSSGVHTLEIWVSDNASNIAYSYYEFFSTINVRLNSPLNNSYQQSDTFINMSFSETPTDVTYKWDSGSYSPILSSLPSVESSHELFVTAKDQSHNVRNFYFHFVTDDTPIQTISLIGPLNDSVVEGGENISFHFSETPYLQYYSWNGLPNSTSTSFIPVVSDSHTLDVFFTDSALNWRSIRYVFHAKIMINLFSHVNNSQIDPNSIICISFGESPDYYEYSIDGLPIQSFTDHNQSLNITFPSSSFTHVLIIRANDSSNGVWNTETYFFDVRIITTITSHTDGGFAESGDPVVVTFSDPPSTVFYSWDNGRNSSRSPTVPSPDGWHVLSIYTGNIEGTFWSYSLDLFVDTDLIDIILISPLNNTRVHSWNNISLAFSEPPNSTLYSWDGGSPFSIPPIFPTTDGGHSLSVTAFDEAGNTNTLSFYWIIDNTPINVSLINAVNGSKIVSQSVLNISFNDETPYMEWYYWDSNPASPVLPPVPFGNGTHTLTINLSDGINWKSYYYIFEVLDYPPIIVVENSDIPYRSNMKLSINITNETIIESWHKWNNGPEITNLTVFTPSFNDGYHKLTIFAKDVGGSFSEVSFLILIDNTPVALESFSPANNSIVSGGETVYVSFNEEPFSVTYSWNGGQPTTNFTIPNQPGDYILHILAYDTAGNLLSTNIRYRIPSPAVDPLPLLAGIGLIIAIVVLVPLAFVKREWIKKVFSSPERDD